MTDLTQLYESAVLRWGDTSRKATDLENQVHQLQEQIWCSGPLGDGTEQLALGVIEHIGGAFETEDAEAAVEHLGKAMVCAASYAYTHGLAFAPILKLARVLTRRDDVQPVHGAGRIAALERAEPIRVAKQVHVVEALGLCIAKGIDDCEILHGLTIEPHGVFLTIGREMLANLGGFYDGAFGFPRDRSTPTRKLGDDGTPHVADDGPGAFKFLRDRVRLERFDPSRHVNPRGICPQCAAPMAPTSRTYIYSAAWSDEDKAYVGLCAEFPSLSWLSKAQDQAISGIVGLVIGAVADMVASGERDTGYRCSNGHELTSEQMNALLGVSTAPDKDP